MEEELQSRGKNGGFAAKTFTRAKTILPTKSTLKNAAEIQFGTKFLFGLLIELIIRCDFSSRGVLGWLQVGVDEKGMATLLLIKTLKIAKMTKGIAVETIRQ